MSRNFKPKGKLAKVISVIAIFAVIIGACAVFAAISRDETKTIGAGEFSRGGLDEKGEHIITDQCVYTKEAFECEGLRIEPDFEFKGTYRVYFYNSDMGFMHRTEELSKVYDGDYPGANFARIVISPDVEAEAEEQGIKAKDWKIRFYEVRKYANDLKITVNKEQTFSETRTENLFNAAAVEENKSFDIERWDNPLVFADADGMKVSEDIIVTEGIVKFQIYVKSETAINSNIKGVITDKVGDNYNVVDSNYRPELTPGKVSNEWTMFEVIVPELDEIQGEAVLKLRMPISCDCVVYGVYED